MKTSGFPSMPGRTALDAFALMDVSDSGISQRLLDHAAAQRHRSANLDGQPEAGRSKRPALRDVIERAEADAGSDEAYFLAQLRQVVAAFETPADRLRARYRQWPSGPAQFCGKRRDWADPRKRTARITGRLPGERQTASDSADAVRRSE